jgi:hypothetical protein
MDGSRSLVVNIRVSPELMDALRSRALEERQPVRRMAVLILEDWLFRASDKVEKI